MSELRKDPLTGRWVIFATEFRQVISSTPQDGTPKSSVCPFCPGQEALTPSAISVNHLPNVSTGAWDVRVIPNKFPVLRVEGMLDSHGEGLYDKINGIGANEVIILSPEHKADLDSISVEQAELAFTVLRDRFLDLKKDIRIHYIQTYKNYGELAGANVAHPHFQLIGLPMIPKAISSEIEGLHKYHSFRGRCLFCDVVRQDVHSPERLVAENEFFIAVTPYASRVAFETWILPKQHQSDFLSLNKAELRAWIRIQQDVLARLKRVLKDPAYNWVLHSAPFQSLESTFFHWHLELIPRHTRFTGFEWGTDYYINPTLPEEAARFLRESSV